jgi:hypothetical protein
MSGYVVVIGNFMSSYGPFATHDEAKKWCEMAEYTTLTENGRCGTTIVPMREPSKAWAFKVRVEITPVEGEWFDKWYTVPASTFEEADERAIAKAMTEYPGRHTYLAFDTAIRN